MRHDGNFGDQVNYEPNSFQGPVEDQNQREPPMKISGNVDRYGQPIQDSDFIQPGFLYRIMKPDEQTRLIQNLVSSLSKVSLEIQKRMIEHFTRADAEYGERVAQGLGLTIPMPM